MGSDWIRKKKMKKKMKKIETKNVNESKTIIQTKMK